MGRVSRLLGLFSYPPLGGRPNTKPGDHGTPNAHNCWFILVYHGWGPNELTIIEIIYGWGSGHAWLHTAREGLWPHYMILEMSWDNLWTRSFGLSQFHGHGSWLVCEVALSLELLWSKLGSNVTSWRSHQTTNRMACVFIRIIFKSINKEINYM